MMAGTLQPGPRNQRDDGAAVQAEAVHDPVSEEGHGIEVSAVLQERQEEIERKDVGDSHGQGRLDSRVRAPDQDLCDHAVAGNHVDCTLDERGETQRPERAEHPRQEVTDDEEEGEDAAQGRGKDGQPRERGRGEAPQPLGEELPVAAPLLHLVGDGAGKAMSLPDDAKRRVLSVRVADARRRLVHEGKEPRPALRLADEPLELGVVFQEEKRQPPRADVRRVAVQERRDVGGKAPNHCLHVGTVFPGRARFGDGLAVAFQLAGRTHRRHRRAQKRLKPFPVRGHRGNHRIPRRRESAATSITIPFLSRLVEQVEGSDHGKPHVEQLQEHVEVARKVRRVQDHDHRVRVSVQDPLPRDPLVFGDSPQRIGSRQVHEADAKLPEPRGGNVYLHRLARVVGRDGPASRSAC